MNFKKSQILVLLLIFLVLIGFIFGFVLFKRITQEQSKDLTDTLVLIDRERSNDSFIEGEFVFNSIDDFTKSRLGHMPIRKDNIDFSTRSLVIINLGIRSNGGYTISVEQATEYNDKIIISVAEGEPGTNCVNTQALLPLLIVFTVENIEDKKIEFKYRTFIENCEL